MTTTITVIRPGAAKLEPFTVAIVANPALEAPWNSNQFLVDPIMSSPGTFHGCANYIDASLFGALPGQAEQLLNDPVIGPQVRIVSIFDDTRPADAANSLVAQDPDSNTLVARRAVFVAFLATYGITADIVYAVSGSRSHQRASAWFTSDDDTQPGTAFILDGATFHHRFYNRIPGTIAIHENSSSMTALHEFQHALSSYTNGKIVDLYVDSGPGVNCKRGRPIPASFGRYNAFSYASDPVRDSLGYEPGWKSYHCELITPTAPALMDNYWKSKSGPPEACTNDAITRAFILDRVRAKLSR